MKPKPATTATSAVKQLPCHAYLVEVDVTVVVVVHVLESWQVEVGKPRVRPLVLVHVLVELRSSSNIIQSIGSKKHNVASKGNHT